MHSANSCLSHCVVQQSAGTRERKRALCDENILLARDVRNREVRCVPLYSGSLFPRGYKYFEVNGTIVIEEVDVFPLLYQFSLCWYRYERLPERLDRENEERRAKEREKIREEEELQKQTIERRRRSLCRTG